MKKQIHFFIKRLLKLTLPPYQQIIYFHKKSLPTLRHAHLSLNISLPQQIFNLHPILNPDWCSDHFAMVTATYDYKAKKPANKAMFWIELLFKTLRVPKISLLLRFVLRCGN